jgi:hypothetical protein
MLINVRVLKWAHYYGISVAWNLLTGFPGETREDYDEQARLMPLLFHLPPPSGGGPVWLERFSPYFTDDSFPVSDVTPWAAYDFVYPEDSVDARKIAYFFSYAMGDTVTREELEAIHRPMQEWQDSWKTGRRPQLIYQRTADWIQIIDQRQADGPRAHSFPGLEAAVYEACGDSYHSAARVASMLGENGGNVSVDQVENALARFTDLGLMIEEEGQHLSLALPVNPNW